MADRMEHGCAEPAFVSLYREGGMWWLATGSEAHAVPVLFCPFCGERLPDDGEQQTASVTQTEYRQVFVAVPLFPDQLVGTFLPSEDPLNLEREG